jgi:hypothetical protein
MSLMELLDVRRLAALDVHGVAGSRRRRGLIRAEFALGAVGGVGLGAWLAVAAASITWQVLGVWIAGVGINYTALAWQAALLSRPGELDAELAGVDLKKALRQYSYLQFWIFVPLYVGVLSLSRTRPDRRNGGNVT